MPVGSGLDKETLKSEIISAVQETDTYARVEGITPEQSTDKFAELLSNAIYNFVRSGKLKVLVDIPLEVNENIPASVSGDIIISGVPETITVTLSGSTIEKGSGKTIGEGTGEII